MRKHILPHAGYKLDPMRHGWVHASGDFIADRDVEDHHTRLTGYVAYRTIKNFFTTLTTGE